jgi:hypothetical protein
MESCRRTVYRLCGLTLLRFISFAALPLLLASLLHAQSTNASLTGRITDSSKAVVPNAKVITINTGTRVHYETVTNDTGSYYVTNLPPLQSQPMGASQYFRWQLNLRPGLKYLPGTNPRLIQFGLKFLF